MATATVYFNLADAYVRIFNMEGAAIAGELTPSTGLIFVQDAKLTETSQVITTPKIGGLRHGVETTGYNRILTIGKWQAPQETEDDWTIALDPLRDYYIKIYQYDPLLGESASDVTPWLLSFCRPKDRSWSTGGRNSLSRVWDVGIID